jgi:hypothetical protein
MVSGDMESHVGVVMNIENTLIPGMQIIRVLHARDVHDHMIDDLCLACQFGGGNKWIY